jgi:type IV pilus assembly protein PilW
VMLLNPRYEQHQRHMHHQQRGFTLIECMIALTLGMLVIAAATALLLTAQQTYLAIDDSARIDDSGATALAALGAAIRQATYADQSGAAAPTPPGNALFGIDDVVLKVGSQTFDQRAETSSAGSNHSDALVTRFMATDTLGAVDPNMLNCAGYPIKKPAAPASAEVVYDWSIFYIARDKSHEPELFCRYYNKKDKFSADAIARGVEAMQLLYGVDWNRDGLPESFLQASAVNQADWPKVVAVSIALSIRGAAAASAPSSAATARPDVRHLFGSAYSAQHASADPGTTLDIARFKPSERYRPRRILRSIVMLRNIRHSEP